MATVLAKNGVVKMANGDIYNAIANSRIASIVCQSPSVGGFFRVQDTTSSGPTYETRFMQTVISAAAQTYCYPVCLAMTTTMSLRFQASGSITAYIYLR